MGIKGLTDRGASFPRIGVLRKGGVKEANRPGKDLDHFRFDSDDADAVDAFLAAYGAEPHAINVLLPFATAAENFDAWREEWTAGALKHRCDGETMTRWLGKDNKYHAEPQPCPGGCKPVGRLMVIIPELRRFAYVTAQTTSLHDIMTLQENLEAAEMLRRDLRGIPFILSRRPREISTPRGDGKRTRVEKWLLSIEPAPSWVGHQLAAMERAALPGGTLRALPDGRQLNVVTGELTDDAPEFDDAEVLPSRPMLTTTAEDPHDVPRKLKGWSWLNDLVLESKARGLKVDDAEQMQMDGMAGLDEIIAMGRQLQAAIKEHKAALQAQQAEDADAELFPAGRPA